MGSEVDVVAGVGWGTSNAGRRWERRRERDWEREVLRRVWKSGLFSFCDEELGE